MQLTTEMLKRFVGGQMEIQSESGRYLYRGEIQAITVENNELRVKFTWLAKGEGFPPIPQKWIKAAFVDYKASLDIYSTNDIGPSDAEIGGDSRLCLMSSILDEIAALFPPNGSKLDPTEVEGLQLARA